MKRLPVVAIGVAALCAFASGAAARSEGMHLAAYDRYRPYADGDWEHVAPRHTRRSARAGKRRHSAHRSGRRHAVQQSERRRHAVRSARRTHVARRAHHSPMAGRGLVSYARGGLSRTCLTPAARGLLERIEAHFGTVGIISTCRPGAVIAGSGRPSRHASGNAIDFNAPRGRKGEVVQWLIANHRAGGVMTYSDMNHIHVDIGHRFVALGSGSGRRRWR
jgi:hypothetical protein